MEEIVKQEQAVAVTGNMYCSIAAETHEDKMRVYSAVSNPTALDDMVGQNIKISDVILQPVELADEETGECYTGTRIVLISPEGTAYSTVSKGIETNMKNLFAIIGEPTWKPALEMKVVRKPARNGYKFLSLETV